MPMNHKLMIPRAGGEAPPGPLAPDAVTSATLFAWFDSTARAYTDNGSTLANNGDAVQRWTAKVSSGLTTNQDYVQQTTGANKPLQSAGGLVFDGSNDVMATANINVLWGKMQNGTGCTIIIHGSADNYDGGGDQGLVSNTNLFNGGSNSFIALCDTSPANKTLRFAARDSGGVDQDYVAADGSVGASPFTIAVLYKANGSGNDARAFVNGTEVVMTAVSDVAITAGGTSLRIGGGLTSGPGLFAGKLKHVIFYDGIVSDAELTRVMAYLAA